MSLRIPTLLKSIAEFFYIYENSHVLSFFIAWKKNQSCSSPEILNYRIEIICITFYVCLTLICILITKGADIRTWNNIHHSHNWGSYSNFIWCRRVATLDLTNVCTSAYNNRISINTHIKLTLSFNRITNEGMDLLVDVVINYNSTLQWLSLAEAPGATPSRICRPWKITPQSDLKTARSPRSTRATAAAPFRQSDRCECAERERKPAGGGRFSY